MTDLLTIGYEGADLDTFIAALKRAKTATVIDVRAAPVSRKPGFSKKALSAALMDAGIDYVHLGHLGTPKAGRDAAKAGDRAGFERIFAGQMATDGFRAHLAEAAAVAGAGGACLICYERDPAECHRSIVAGELARDHGFAVRDLMV